MARMTLMADIYEATPGRRHDDPSRSIEEDGEIKPLAKRTENPQVSEDYFETLGDLVEKHPIGRHSAHGCVVSPDD